MLSPGILRKKSDFDNLYKNGKSVGDRYVVVFYIKNGLDYNRTAFLASKKVGNSVIRNRARRLMKESYKYILKDITIGYDILFIARKTIVNMKLADVKKSIEAALRKIKLVKSGRNK